MVEKIGIIITKHTANRVKQWFTDEEVSIMPWPAQSPDLNPIENLWSILDQRLRGRKCNNRTQLIEALKKGWEELDESILTRLVDSMPSRIQKVIEAKGFATKY